MIKCLNSEYIYSGPINVRLDQVQLPNGKETTHTVLEYKPSVAIVPCLPNGNVILLRQYRYVMQGWNYELPAGIVEENEIIEEAALRELKEESGYCASNLEYIMTVFPDTCLSTQKIYIYIATGLSSSTQSLEDTEMIDEVVEVDCNTIAEMLTSGQIGDAITVLGLQAYLLRMDR